jgi:hypothetical protein
VAELETLLDEIIAAYFTTSSRSPAFTELVLSKLSAWAKVSVVERLPYKRRPRSLRHIETLKDIIQARNFVAHTHYLPPGELPARVQPWLYLLSDYPTGYEAHIRSIKRMFRSLRRARDIANTCTRRPSLDTALDD